MFIDLDIILTCVEDTPFDNDVEHGQLFWQPESDDNLISGI